MYHAKPKTVKIVMTVLGAVLVALAPQYPQFAAAMLTIGGVLGGGAHVPQPGSRGGK